MNKHIIIRASDFRDCFRDDFEEWLESNGYGIDSDIELILRDGEIEAKIEEI